MKRILCAGVCALLLLCVLPAVTPPATMAVAGILRPESVKAYVGDFFHWYAYGCRVTGDYLVNIRIYKDGEFLGNSDFYSTDGFGVDQPAIIAMTFREPGIYDGMLVVTDSEGTDVFRSGIVTVTLRLGPKNVKAAVVSGTSLKLSWSAVASYTKYQVFRADTAAGPYTQVAEIEGTAWNDTALTTGKRYFYKIRSCWFDMPLTRITSEFSAPVVGVPIGKASIASVTATGKDRIKLVITPVPGATGYEISTAPKAGGPYTVLRTTTASTLTITGLKPDTIYFFKVRAYKRIYSVNYYGALSGYRSAKTLK